MIGALGFLSPWLLVALAVLPLIWLILRLTPPRPRQVDFPPTAILFDLQERERTPARTPWWLTALRLLLVALVVAAMAEPILRPDSRVTAAGSEPLLVVLDDGWDAAPDFAARINAARAAVAEAERDGRPVALVTTSGAQPDNFAARDADAVEAELATLVPRPWLPDRGRLAAAVAANVAARSVEALWIAGAARGASGDDGDRSLAEALVASAGRATLMRSGRPLAALSPPANGVDDVGVPIWRVGGGAGTVGVAGYDAEGRRIVETSATVDPDGRGVARIRLPTEIRNSLARLAITGEASAGAVQLLDSRWLRKSVGLIVGEGSDAPQPLLDPLTYVERALAPTADLLRSPAGGTSAAIATLIARGASVIVLTESGRLPPDAVAALAAWVERGGTLVRFASPSLAVGGGDGLLPVRLREGERSLGGSLSWEQPQAIGPFPAASPFARIAVPADVEVNRQVLADPDALGEAEIWAELADGTPLVTAAARGAGRLVLFHVTADPRWSNLPISGAFVDMMNAVVAAAGVVAPADAAASGTPAAADAAADGDAAGERPSAAPWKPLRLLDGFGALGTPDPNAALSDDLAAARPGPTTPPGLYDRDGTVRALNAVAAADELAALDPAALGWSGGVLPLDPEPPTPIWPWLLTAAAMLAILDGLAVLLLAGRLSWRVSGRASGRVSGAGGRLPRAAAGTILLALAILAPGGQPARAQDLIAGGESAADKAITATSKTQLAYVLTGDATIDETSEAGLKGLSMYLADRTAMEPGDPAPLDLAADELAFYALIYWPIDAAAPTPSAAAMAKVETFLNNGGTILFDTRDAGGFDPSGTAGGATPETQKLREILGFVDVPPLEPVPPDHVLTKAFYLLAGFPGRWDDSQLWVESLAEADPAAAADGADRPARGGDGVSPILITGNDMAAAWAVDAGGLWLYPTVPADPRQREMSFRAGVNIVMYSLTGNYKADQVHIPALLERLGQ